MSIFVLVCETRPLPVYPVVFQHAENTEYFILFIIKCTLPVCVVNLATSHEQKEMQMFFGLNVTGTLDKVTLEVMKKSHGGVPDVVEFLMFGKNNNQMAEHTSHLQVSKVTPMKFTRIYSGTADIMISFATKGKFHLSIYLFLYFVLFKSPMLPFYSFTDPDHFSLSNDDMTTIQSLYGKPMIFKSPPGPPTTLSDCRNLVWDAVTTFKRETMFFKDSFLWFSSPKGNEAQLPVKSFWPNAPDNINAAYEDLVEDIVFLFKTTFSNNLGMLKPQSPPGYPKPLSSFGLPESVAKVDAAVHDKNSGKTLFFVNRYYKYYNSWVLHHKQNSSSKGLRRVLKNNYFLFC
uniref:Uncharacterized protein n=1 Tax=Cyprinus carpio TaxID=7962 RepID=A0A8C1IDJ4_CYPCA